MRKSAYFAGADAIPGEAVTLVPNTCLSKAADDEPIFVLRAKDPIAADVVEIWATLASKHHEFEKTVEAKECAQQMRVWLIAQLEAQLNE